MAGISITVDDRPVLDALTDLVARGKNPAPALDEIGQWMVSGITGLFLTGTDPFGQPWPPSARASEEGGKTLVDRGHLRDANTYYVQGDELVVGNSMVYAAAHNQGVDEMVSVAAHQRLIEQAFGRPLSHPIHVNVRAHSRHMKLPKRQFVPTDGLPEGWQAEIMAIFSDYLMEPVNG